MLSELRVYFECGNSRSAGFLLYILACRGKNESVAKDRIGPPFDTRPIDCHAVLLARSGCQSSFRQDPS